MTFLLLVCFLRISLACCHNYVGPEALWDCSRPFKAPAVRVKSRRSKLWPLLGETAASEVIIRGYETQVFTKAARQHVNQESGSRINPPARDNGAHPAPVASCSSCSSCSLDPELTGAAGLVQVFLLIRMKSALCDAN